MSINQLLTNYNTLSSGTLFIPSSGSGGGTGTAISSFNTFYASTLNINTTDPNGLAVSIQAGGAANTGAIIFTNADATQDLYSLGAVYNTPATKYDLVISDDNGVGPLTTGNLVFNGFNNIDANTMNMNISTVNGARVLTGTGAVNSVNGSAFKDILVTPTTGAPVVTLGTKFALCPAPSTASFSFTVNTSAAASGLVFDFNALTNPGKGFDLTQLAQGWYEIFIDSISINVPAPGVLNAKAYPGSVINHSIRAGSTTDYQEVTIDSYTLAMTAANAVEPNVVQFSLRGIFYLRPALGLNNVLQLRTYFNSADSIGTGTTGTWSYSNTASGAPGRVIIVPLLGGV